MSPKKEAKLASLKGEEAETKVLEYLKRVNRPYASTDISANLKNVVSKSAAQKALLTLAEKGSLTKKDYGKQTIFVVPQQGSESGSEDGGASSGLEGLDDEIRGIQTPLEETRKRCKMLQTELGILLAMPTTPDLVAQIKALESSNSIQELRLAPLRAGEQSVSPEDLLAVDDVWRKERAEWMKRRKVYLGAMDLVHGDKGKTERREWEEEQGIEQPSDEVIMLEAGSMCATNGELGKRKR